MPRTKGNRRGGRNGGSSTRTVTALSASQAWDKTLATAKDRCRVNDRVPYAVITSSTGTTNSFAPLAPIATNGTTTVPGIFGQRVYSIAQNYTRYRINRLLICYRPIVGTTTAGLIGIGVSDDPAPSPQPGTTTQVAELRCSHVDSVYREIEIEWRPVQPGTWFFVDSAIAQDQADYRLEFPGALATALSYGASAATNYGQVYLYYDITFEGATENQSGAV